jgi:hypothetical protein
MESIIKMAILHLSIRSSEPCIFISTIFKNWNLIENYIRINDTFEFFDSLSISSEIELALGSSQIKFFLIIFHHFLRDIKFRVDPMIYFGSLVAKETKWRTKSRWPPSMNFP